MTSSNKIAFVILVVCLSFCPLGCMTKPKVLLVDLAPYVTAASERFNGNGATPTATARLEVTGTRAGENLIGIHTAYLDNGIRSFDSGKRVLTTSKPLGTYVQDAMSRALLSQGVDTQDDGATSVVVELTRFEYPWKNSQFQSAIIEANASVMAGGESIYSRGFAVEANRDLGNLSQGLDAGGIGAAIASQWIPGMGLVSGVARTAAERQRVQEYKEIFNSCWTDSFAKLQDQLLEDKDFISAIKTATNPLAERQLTTTSSE